MREQGQCNPVDCASESAQTHPNVDNNASKIVRFYEAFNKALVSVHTYTHAPGSWNDGQPPAVHVSAVLDSLSPNLFVRTDAKKHSVDHQMTVNSNTKFSANIIIIRTLLDDDYIAEYLNLGDAVGVVMCGRFWALNCPAPASNGVGVLVGSSRKLSCFRLDIFRHLPAVKGKRRKGTIGWTQQRHENSSTIAMEKT